MARKVTARKAPAKKAGSRKGAPRKAAAPARKKAATKKKAAPKQAPAPKVKAAAKRPAAAKKKAAQAKSAMRAKAAAPRKAAARKAAPARKPAPRVKPRGRAAAPPPRKVARLTTKAAPQRFMVSHLDHGDFKRDGLRPYAFYRDLGIAAATGGLCQAHVIRLISPCTDEVRKRHLHETELQLIYVLQGWVKNEFEGHGEQMMSQGSCWLQPPGIKHTVLDYSADCELLEIIVPADFKTVELT